MHYLIESLKPFCEVRSYLHFTDKKTETMGNLYTEWVVESNPGSLFIGHMFWAML